MEKIGVEAVVEGLSGFLQDLDQIDNAISKLASGDILGGASGLLSGIGGVVNTLQSAIHPTNILGSAFEGLSHIVTGVLSSALRTLEYTLGNLVAGAISFVASGIQDLIASSLEAGSEFQSLSIRLNQLNFNDLDQNIRDRSYAMDAANKQTREQLYWLQRLAATTPFDNQDIANVYTLARGYNFTDREARGLVETLADFTSGMGLGNVEMVRIIKNLGQMQQLGKVTQRELNDLAVGAFVPVNDILQKMQVETGLAGEEFKDFRNSAEGVASFLRNFTELVDQDFNGAAQRMARTWKGATDNFKDFFKSILGLNVIKPVLDVLGGRLADFMDELTEPARWDMIVGWASRMGSAVANVVSDITGMAPSAEGMADLVVGAFQNITEWVEENRTKINDFVTDAVSWFQNDLTPAIQQVWSMLFGSEGEPGAIQKFGAWLKDDLMPFIQREVLPGLEELFNAITGQQAAPVTTDPKDRGDTVQEPDTTAFQGVVESVIALSTALPAILELIGAIGSAISTSFGGDEAQTFAEFINTTLIPSIQALTQWVRENEGVVRALFVALIALEVFGIIAGMVLSLVAGLTALVVAILIFVATMALTVVITTFLTAIVVAWNLMVNTITSTAATIKTLLADFKESFAATFQSVKDAITGGDWSAAGQAIIDGVAHGIESSWDAVISLVERLARDALATFNSIFHIASPSKVMQGIGENIVRGLAKGVSDSAGMAIKEMSQTAKAMLVAATPKMSYSSASVGPSQNTYQTNNQFNLNVNTAASREPIVQDFNLMQSMVGA